MWREHRSVVKSKSLKNSDRFNNLYLPKCNFYLFSFDVQMLSKVPIPDPLLEMLNIEGIDRENVYLLSRCHRNVYQNQLILKFILCCTITGISFYNSVFRTSLKREHKHNRIILPDNCKKMKQIGLSKVSPKSTKCTCYACRILNLLSN